MEGEREEGDRSWEYDSIKFAENQWGNKINV